MNRNPTIDALRGICILWVILLHCNIHLPLAKAVLPSPLFSFIFWNGYYAVILFFVISGCLITSTSLKRWGNLQDISYQQFYRLRFARIAPCLFALLIILCILDQLKISGFAITNTSLAQALLSTLSFRISYLEAKISYLPANWDVLWSLSIEEVFYLFFPLFCILLKKPRKIMLALGLFILAGPLARIYYASNEILSDRSFFSCLDGIAIGCLVALITAGSVKIPKKLCLGLGLIFLAWILIFRGSASGIFLAKFGMNISVLEWGMGLILLSLPISPIPINSLLNTLIKPLGWYGRHSYEIYLSHSFFVILLAENVYQAKESWLFTGFLYVIIVALSGFSGQGIARYFSEPLRRYLHIRVEIIHNPQRTTS